MKLESTKAEIKNESPNIANAMLGEVFDWIDDFATTATKKQLKQERRNLIKHKNVVKNYEYKLNKLNQYIGV